MCAGRFGLGWTHDVFKFACHMFMHFHAYIHSFIFILILILLVLFYVFLSLPLSFVSCFMDPKQKFTPSQNLLCFGASSSFDTTPSHVRFHDDKARKDFSENLFWWGIHLEHQVILSNFFNSNLPTVIYTRGWESLYGNPITYPSMIIQEFYSNMHGFDTSIPHYVTCVRGTRIVVTPDIEILHIPRVAHPDYPSYDCLRIVSKDELSSLFCEKPSSRGDRQNTSCSGFAKGPRFLNMVMTFILHPLFHYNSITEPRAWFLLSLLKDIFIDFPSHFILFLIDVYRDTTTRDKLIFPSAIMRFLCHFFCLLSLVSSFFSYECHRCYYY